MKKDYSKKLAGFSAWKGLFSFFDQGNLKFYFPRFHHWLYCCLFKEESEYQEKFESNQNMFGDFVRQQKMRHRHYSLKDLERLLNR